MSSKVRILLAVLGVALLVLAVKDHLVAREDRESIGLLPPAQKSGAPQLDNDSVAPALSAPEPEKRAGSRSAVPALLLSIRVASHVGISVPEAVVLLSAIPSRGRPVCTARSDSQGLVHFQLDPSNAEALRISAHAGHMEGELVIVPPFLPSTHTLHLQSPCAIEVQVKDGAGGPLAGARVRVDFEDGDPENALFREETDSRGRARFEALPPGRLFVVARDPRTKKEARVRANIASGDTEAIELVLSHPDEELAVSGHVLDESGRPLRGVRIVVRPPARSGERIESGRDGSFEAWLRPCEKVVLSVGDPRPRPRSRSEPRSAGEGVFDPSSTEVPFGTKGVVLRRVQTLEAVWGSLLAVDSKSGKQIDGALLRLEQTFPVENTVQSNSTPMGLNCYVVPSTRWTVSAQGYKCREGLLPALLAMQAVAEETTPRWSRLPPKQVFRIELEPGF